MDVFDELYGEGEKIFISHDLTLTGNHDFPRQDIQALEYSKDFLLGGIVPMSFSKCPGMYRYYPMFVNLSVLVHVPGVKYLDFEINKYSKNFSKLEKCEKKIYFSDIHWTSGRNFKGNYFREYLELAKIC